MCRHAQASLNEFYMAHILEFQKSSSPYGDIGAMQLYRETRTSTYSGCNIFESMGEKLAFGSSLHGYSPELQIKHYRSFSILIFSYSTCRWSRKSCIVIPKFLIKFSFIYTSQPHIRCLRII